MNEREDKKTQTKPFVSLLVHEVVEDVRQHLGTASHGDAARRIVLASLDDIAIIETLSPYFWRTYSRGEHMWPGHEDRWDINELLPDPWTKTKRLPIRFQKPDWKRVQNLAFALECDRANTVAVVLRLAIESESILRHVAPGFNYRSRYSLRNGVFQRGVV